MKNQRRAKNVAIVGAVFQLCFTVVMLVIWLWTDSLTAMTCSWFLAGGVPLWLVAALLSYCRQLERQEALELEELAGSEAASQTIFQNQDSREIRPAAARMAWMERWIGPLFTVLFAVANLAMGLVLLRVLPKAATGFLANTGQGIMVAAPIWLLAFLFSRYATGMASRAEWRLLRAPGSYLLVNVLGILLVIAALLASYQNYGKFDRYLAFVVPIIQIVLSIELFLNFVLDLYRPRVPGQEPHPSFDSRLLNLLAEPGRVGHSIAETLNYQFGFEVSKTWFYQLLGKSMTPLLIFGAAVLWAMSSIVVVQQGEQYVVMHWGKLDAQRPTLRSGINFKLPWPIETARRFDTGQIKEIVLGVGDDLAEDKRKATIIKGREVNLWTQEHGPKEEKKFLVAVAPREGDSAGMGQKPPPPVNIIKLVVSVQYVVDDVKKYGFKYVDPDKLLENVANRELIRYCASATLDAPVGGADGDRPEAIMTYGRERAARELRERIQAAAGEGRKDAAGKGEEGLGLGVNIISVAIQAVHPPSDAAPAYEAVLEAERRQEEIRYVAEGYANKMLSNVAGDPFSARRLAFAIRRLDELTGLRNASGDAAEFNRAMSQVVSRLNEDIAFLQKEIDRERLLGRVGADKSNRLLLMELYRQQLTEWQAMKEGYAKGQAIPFDVRIADARKLADELFRTATGEPAAMVAQAQSDSWNKRLTEQARAENFSRELMAYQASPRLYELDRRLDVWDQVLPDITKYVLGVDRNRIEVWLDFKQDRNALEDATYTPKK